jgi:hypothetical protein
MEYHGLLKLECIWGIQQPKLLERMPFLGYPMAFY